MQISKDMKCNLLKNNNLIYEKENEHNTIKLSNPIFDKKMGNNIANVFTENTKERNEKSESKNCKQFNGIISYFNSTAQYLKDSNKYNRFNLSMINSKNYIPKIVFQNKNHNEEYENNNTNNNDFYNNKKCNNFNYYNFEQKTNADNNKVPLNNKYINRNCLPNVNVLFSIKIEKGLIYNNPFCIKKDEEKNILNGYNNLFYNNINYPFFFPSNYNKKDEKNSFINSNHSERTESTSSLSEKGEDNNFNDTKNEENLQQKSKEDEYLTEMFGRKGWICILCNNFNYQARNKCNRCGDMKKPKKIFNIKERNKEIKESNNNSKNGWICMNCNNFNCSFMNVCNRCKNYRTNKIKCNPLYSFTPPFNIFNIIYNINKKFN